MKIYLKIWHKAALIKSCKSSVMFLLELFGYVLILDSRKITKLIKKLNIRSVFNSRKKIKKRNKTH